jgi:hypothetical protein
MLTVTLCQVSVPFATHHTLCQLYMSFTDIGATIFKGITVPISGQNQPDRDLI